MPPLPEENYLKRYGIVPSEIRTVLSRSPGSQ